MILTLPCMNQIHRIMITRLKTVMALATELRGNMLHSSTQLKHCFFFPCPPEYILHTES